MLEKLIGEKIEIMPKQAKENEILCDVCGGTGWLQDKENHFIEKCRHCYDGIINLCPICHNPMKGLCMNEACSEQRDREAEQRRYEKAIKAKYEEMPSIYNRMMYSDSYGYNEGYFADFEELIEYCEGEETEIPKYVWSTTEIGLSMDACAIIDTACDDLHESARDNIVDEDKLQEFLDKWCARQTGVNTYVVNYKYAIEVDQRLLRRHK
jgi:hypothetical protein